MVGVKLWRIQKGRQFALPLSICAMVLALALAWLLRDRVMEAIWLSSIITKGRRATEEEEGQDRNRVRDVHLTVEVGFCTHKLGRIELARFSPGARKDP